MSNGLPSSWRCGRAATRRSLCGFTISEVLIASVVLVIALSAVLLTLTASRRSSEMALRQTAAMHLARARLEILTQSTFDNLPAGGATPYSGGTSYTVTSVDSLTKNIQVRATWATPILKRTNTVVLTTSISETLHK